MRGRQVEVGHDGELNFKGRTSMVAVEEGAAGKGGGGFGAGSD